MTFILLDVILPGGRFAHIIVAVLAKVQCVDDYIDYNCQ